MKKLILAIIFLMIFGIGTPDVLAAKTEDAAPVIEASVQFDWINMLQFQREEKVEKYKQELFSSDDSKNFTKKDFRAKYISWLKDREHKSHYRLISNGVRETNDVNMSGFFRKFNGEDILYSYALQPKDDMRHVYYYSAIGHLAYVDDISENYPNFPYYSKQYRSNGKLAGVIYFESKNLQYTYAPNGKFKGVWYKDKMYDIKGKEVLTRTNW